MTQGKLSRSDKTQLEEWIGSGRKYFTLLYSATKDGCSNIVFHQKCDNEGPTVTVLYNPHGTVYGGYTGVSWSNLNGINVNSASEFIFRLYYNGSLKAMKFPLKHNAQQGIYMHSKYGPTFGEGHDLHTFQGTINVSRGIFALNGSMNFGYSYDNQGLTTNDINNDAMNVTELEVYKVTEKQLLTKDREPWRKMDDWNEETLNTLKEEIQTFTPLEDAEVAEARLVLIGPVGAGKSSFFNSVDSAFTGRLKQRACSGSAEQSISTMYVPYRIKGNGCTPKFRLCDTPGLEKSKGLEYVEFNYLLEGNMPDYYELNPNCPLKPATPGFKATPSMNDMVHCVLFVLDATTVDALSTEFLEKIKQFKLSLYRKGISHMVLLTKVDKLCKDVKQDTTNIYKSEIVEDLVNKTADLLGIPPMNIHPIKNYATEVKCDINVSIPVLSAMSHALSIANDFLQYVVDRKVDENVTQEI